MPLSQQTRWYITENRDLSFIYLYYVKMSTNEINKLFVADEWATILWR